MYVHGNYQHSFRSKFTKHSHSCPFLAEAIASSDPFLGIGSD